MNITFLDAATVGHVESLEKIREYGTLTLYDTTSPEQVVPRLQDTDIALTNKVVLDRNNMSMLPRLKLICITATGMNNVDLDCARERDIQVKNAAGYSTNSVAQHTLAAILHLMHRPDYYDHYVKSGEYSRSGLFTHYGPAFNELAGKMFGVIGLGAIGSRVAALASAFGAEVCYYSTSGRNDNRMYKRTDLDKLLEQSDVVSIHAPLNEKTDGLIGYDRLRQMKAGAILVNAGRGGIVHEKDLAKVLDEGHLWGACLDVFDNEPLQPDSPLLKINNNDRLLLSPHIAWTSREAREKLIQITADNIRGFIR